MDRPGWNDHGPHDFTVAVTVRDRDVPVVDDHDLNSGVRMHVRGSHCAGEHENSGLHVDGAGPGHVGNHSDDPDRARGPVILR